MRILETSTEAVVLDVWRQTSPINSAGSSPTPTSISSPLPEAISVTSSKSKSETLAVRSSSWETPSDTSHSAESSKNLRTSGSQTDSLDSPGPSPRKKLDGHNHVNPTRMLDKAKERMEKILRPRNRSNEREKDSDKKDRLESQRHSSYEMKSIHKPVEDCGTQVNLPTTENVIAEFTNNTMFTKVPTSPQAAVAPQDSISRIPKSPRKRELEVDSNSGTWPKTRGGQQGSGSAGPPTIGFLSGHKPVKERPSIRDVFYGNSDSPKSRDHGYERTISETVHHTSQNSDSSIKYPGSGFTPPTSLLPSSLSTPSSSTVVMTTAFSHSSPSVSPILSQPVHSNNLPLPLPSTLTSTPTVSSSIPTAPSIIPLSKSQSYFTVGIMHDQLSPTSPHPQQQRHIHHSHHPMSSRAGPPVINKYQGNSMYGTLPSQKSQGYTQRGSLVPHSNVTNSPPVSTDYSATLPPHRVPQKVSQVRTPIKLSLLSCLSDVYIDAFNSLKYKPYFTYF